MAPRPKKTLYERTQEADVRAGTYLADANEASEAGKHALATKLYDKAQFWLDRYNLLSGNGNGNNRPRPKY
jgi:hypothetical protein